VVLSKHLSGLGLTQRFNDLHHITLRYGNDPRQQANNYHQADLDARLLYTEHRLIKCQNEGISEDNEVQRSFCVACLIFISLSLRRVAERSLDEGASSNHEGIKQTCQNQTGRAYEHEVKLIVLMIMLSWMWALPTALYPGAPPSYYTGVSQLPTNPLNRDKS
jgi:hypothetical protein